MNDSSAPVGYCECGCGQKTGIAKQTHAKLGHVEGQPYRFIKGHAAKRGSTAPETYRRNWQAEHPDIPYGSCCCGCGDKTELWARTVSSRGRVAGEPKRYVRGHNRRLSDTEYLAEDRGYGSPCWIWQRNKDRSGYGQITVGPKGGQTCVKAHRVYYERERGPIPIGLQLDHLCRVRDCVNPDHLEPVTLAENARRGFDARYGR